MNESKRVIKIFDTTLRDGEQSPGAALSNRQKLEIAKQLAKLNIDVIEAGFPVSSPDQFEAVARISEEVDCTIASLARAKESDILAAHRAMQMANRARIHTFIGTSDQHILGKFADKRYGASLAEKRETVLKMATDAVYFAKELCHEVEFSAEDAGRTDRGYLADICHAAIEAGAKIINIPDTTGYQLPHEFADLIRFLKGDVLGMNEIELSVHCHNDLGLAVANSLAAIQAGADQVECTVNGIGERAGNAAMEEIVMALNVRGDASNATTRIDTREIFNASRMVSSHTGIVVQPNKAVVGDNAFAHESGIHQDGMLKSRDTYEIMNPEEVGVSSTKIVLGRHSGKHGLQSRLKAIGYDLNSEEISGIYEDFLKLADKKKEVFDEDLRALMGEMSRHEREFYRLKCFQITSGSQAIPKAKVFIHRGNEVVQGSAVGDGPVDACFNAIESALRTRSSLESYQVRSVTSGRQALGEVSVRLRWKDQLYVGKGVSTDILQASAEAFIHAANQQFAHEQEMNQNSEQKEKAEAGV